MSEWISVKDKLPTEFEEVIFHLITKDSPFKKDIVCGHFSKGVWYICFLYTSQGLNENVEVTHWMPLPEPPHE